MTLGKEDSGLADRLKGGDEAALVELMGRFKEPLHAFAYRMTGSAADADDIAQETFVRAFTKAASFDPRRATLSTWLFQIARNLAIDCLRRRRADIQPLDESAAQLPTVGQTPAADAERGEVAAAVASAVGALPEDQRTAFVLAEYEGLSYREIAMVMSSSEKSVEARLYRAKQSLRVALRPFLGDIP